MNRTNAFRKAKELVDPIIDQHGLEAYREAPNIFVPPGNRSAVDQHINHILYIAEWLMEGDT